MCCIKILNLTISQKGRELHLHMFLSKTSIAFQYAIYLTTDTEEIQIWRADYMCKFFPAWRIGTLNP